MQKMTGGQCYIIFHLSDKIYWSGILLKKDASVLEIGAGCGAVSGVLCRNAKHVTSVDLSKRRSLINANRNKEYDNLTIMVGNFNDVVLKEKYDYITLIGVLEYAGYYTDDEHPFEAF